MSYPDDGVQETSADGAVHAPPVGARPRSPAVLRVIHRCPGGRHVNDHPAPGHGFLHLDPLDMAGPRESTTDERTPAAPPSESMGELAAYNPALHTCERIFPMAPHGVDQPDLPLG